MEVIICTPAQAGYWGDHSKNKNDQKFKNKQKFIHNLIALVSTPVGVGGLIVLFVFANFFGSLPHAEASSSLSVNLELAQKIIDDISPVVSEDRVDTNSANLAFAPEGYLNKPLVTETQVTKEVVKTQTSSKVATQKKYSQSAATKVAVDAGAHRFPYGYCTYYASQRRFVPWSGNAIAWLYGAQSFGFATGSTPQVGAIVVTSEGGKTGHVGIIDNVSGDQITITEMNYRGFGVISSRTISSSYGAIMGYIY